LEEMGGAEKGEPVNYKKLWGRIGNTPEPGLGTEKMTRRSGKEKYGGLKGLSKEKGARKKKRLNVGLGKKDPIRRTLKSKKRGDSGKRSISCSELPGKWKGGKVNSVKSGEGTGKKKN